jgi:hypothetical protein
VSEWKDLVRSPFANYDIVVYFGCGLFSLPLIHHYIVEPAGLRFPRFQLQIGIQFADAAVSTLSLLFAVYILGHMIAYAGSVTIEKTIDLSFGKISSAIIISSIVAQDRQEETVQGWMARRVQEAFAPGQRTASALRYLFLIPAIPVLFLMFVLHWFSYFRTRVPPRVFAQVRKEALRRGYGRVGLHTKWYKAVEHDVINNNPVATARMYNYLVIYGLFRSLAFLFIMCGWAELYYLLHGSVDGDWLVKPIMSERAGGAVLSLLALSLYNVIFSFCLVSYIKFSRRYVEEALFAFVIGRSAK